MKPIVTWVLIADGTQARIMQNTGPGRGLTQVNGMNFSQEPLQAQELVSDRPGRTHLGGMEPKSDPVERRETEFVKSVTDLLELKRNEGAFDRLVIAAAPIALGDIRKALSPLLRQTVLAELPKDLIKTPTNKLGAHLDGILAI